MQIAPIIVSLTLGYSLLGCAGSQRISVEERHAESALDHLHRLTPELYSAGEPVGEPAYRELAAMGIRSVISVDGIAPNKELADRYNIRVVHIPTTYDGITDEQSNQLAHAIATLPRPILVNCHHGKHRGPAALCVGAIGAGEISNDRARAYLQEAQTSQKYRGLWSSVDDARPLDTHALRNESIKLPEAVGVGDFVDAMAELSRLGDLLNDCADNAFQAPEGHPDLAPVSLAGQMHNIFRELEDDPVTAKGGEDFLSFLRGSSDLASMLEQQIERDETDNAYGTIQRLFESCSDCHERFGRDG